VQAEETVEVDGGFSATALGFWDGYARAHLVVAALAEGDDYVQAVHGAALEEDYHFLFAWGRRGGYGALEEAGHGGEAEHGYAAVF
jgi:hypothetical protein